MIMIILIFIFLIIAFFMYCIIVGGNLNKSDEERKMEYEEQIQYLDRIGENSMERIFIDKNWLITYILLAFESIENSANQERTIEDFLEEIQVMSNIYTNDVEIKKINKKLNKKFRKRKVAIID